MAHFTWNPTRYTLRKKTDARARFSAAELCGSVSSVALSGRTRVDRDDERGFGR
jgi:hypothetical protein